MNAPVPGFGTDHRLNRIKLVSRIAKYVSFAVLGYSIVIFIWSPRIFLNGGWGPIFLKSDTVAILIMAGVQAGLWLWYQRLMRLPRFQDRTQLVLFAVVVQFWLVVGYWKMLEIPPFSAQAWHYLVVTALQLVIWMWYWKLARLFLHYERGQIFAAATIRCLKALGLLCVIGWLLYSALHYFPANKDYAQAVAHPGQVVYFANPPTAPSNQAVDFVGPVQPQFAGLSPRTGVLAGNGSLIFPAEQPHLVGVSKSRRSFQTGFFSFDFGTGINFGLLFTGLTIVLVAWIMDESRKIKEEQELTV